MTSGDERSMDCGQYRCLVMSAQSRGLRRVSSSQTFVVPLPWETSFPTQCGIARAGQTKNGSTRHTRPKHNGESKWIAVLIWANLHHSQPSRQSFLCTCFCVYTHISGTNPNTINPSPRAVVVLARISHLQRFPTTTNNIPSVPPARQYHGRHCAAHTSITDQNTAEWSFDRLLRCSQLNNPPPWTPATCPSRSQPSLSDYMASSMRLVCPVTSATRANPRWARY